MKESDMKRIFMNSLVKDSAFAVTNRLNADCAKHSQEVIEIIITISDQQIEIFRSFPMCQHVPDQRLSSEPHKS